MPRVKVKNQNGEFELRDEIRQPLYDTVTQAAAESPIAVRTFFTSTQGKTLAQTNMRQPSQLEGQVSFRVLGMVLDAQNIVAADYSVLPLMMERTSLQLRIGEKIYWQGNSLYGAGRLEQSVAAATTVAATTIDHVHQRFGDTAVQAINLGGKHFIDIPPIQSFVVQWVGDVLDFPGAALAAATPSSPIRYYLSLKGLLRRPVQ
jgi:hypothetical protein